MYTGFRQEDAGYEVEVEEGSCRCGTKLESRRILDVIGRSRKWYRCSTKNDVSSSTYN
jgi:hypothetical protein